MAENKLDEAATSDVSANSADSAKGAKKKPLYPSKKYIQSWYCPEDKTWILKKLETLREEYGLGRSELMVMLLERCLQMIDDGEIKFKGKTVTKTKYKLE